MATLKEPLIEDTSILIYERHSRQRESAREQTNNDERKLEKSYFDVMGLCCSSEVPLIERVLKQLNGVQDISVVVPTRTVIVVHDVLNISSAEIARALNQAGLEAGLRPREEGNKYTKKRSPGMWNIASGVLLSLSFLKYVYPPMQWLAIGAVLIGLPNILFRGVASIRNLTININIIVLVAVGGTIALQDYTDAGIIVFLYNIAQWLESRASEKAMSVMSSLTSLTPQQATLAESGEQVNVASIKLGTVIAVKAGEVVPVDGVVVEGKCEVDEKALTGESFPVTKEIGSTVWAGSINLNGYISVRTTALAENFLVSRMVDLVEEAQGRKARIQTFIDNCAKWYIPVVVLISAAVALVPIVLKVGDKLWWFHLALIVLVSACPCALVISTPVTVFCALSKAATIGLLFKGGDYLELLAKVKTVAFDKTGTITRGDFVVTHFQSLLETVSVEKLLFWVSSIESKSSHPMAAALVNYAVMRSIDPLPEKVEEFHNYPGEGIHGKIESEHIHIGNHRISQRAGLTESYGLESHMVAGKVSGFIFIGATLAGTFSLSDDCRTGAREAMRELKMMGIRTEMLTGDNHSAAQRVQNQLEQSLDVVHAQLLPEDKAEIIEGLKKEGAVAMVGDGINDALALATADIGISMGISGSALATETGHVILMSNDIRKIPEAIQISKRASTKIIENVAISFTTKGVIFALALAGYPMLLAAVLTDVGTCLLVILNSMLLLQDGTPKYSQNESDTKEIDPCGRTTRVCKANKSSNSGRSTTKSGEITKSLQTTCCGSKSGEVRGSLKSGSCGSKSGEDRKSVTTGCCGAKSDEVGGSLKTGCCGSKSSEVRKPVTTGCCEAMSGEVGGSPKTGCCRAKSGEIGASIDTRCCGAKSAEFGGSLEQDIEKQEEKCGGECCSASTSRFSLEGSMQKTCGVSRCSKISSCRSGNCRSSSRCAQVCGNTPLDIVIS